jgi:hypothetical protein
MIYTNGIGLDKELLTRLKKAGVTQLVIHIDKFQKRSGVNTISELNTLRVKYCDLFREVEGVNLGFIQPLSKSCLNDLDELAQFFTQNRDIVSLIVFTLYREIHWKHKKLPKIDTSIRMEDVLSKLESIKVFKRTAFLPPTKDSSDTAWVFSYSIGTTNKILGFLNSLVYKRIQQRYYKFKGRHLFISKRYNVDYSGVIKLIFHRGIFRILVRALASPFKKLYFQTYLVIRGPVKSESGWDLCDGCPDAMYYKGKLIPSCILEDIKEL